MSTGSRAKYGKCEMKQRSAVRDEWRLTIDRLAPRKPRPLVGVKRSYLKMSNFLSGKLRPLVGELH